MSCCTLSAYNAAAEEVTAAKASDPSTMDDWKMYFGTDVMSTKNTGTVWTDKSVLTDSSAFGGSGIEMKDRDDFLVAMSAMASDSSVTGYSNVPTDTMFVLDVSGSMNDDAGHNNMAKVMVEAANDSIAELLSANKYSRIGVVLYSGSGSSSKDDDAAVLLLPLDRYTTAEDGKYLSYTVTSNSDSDITTETIGIAPDLRTEETKKKPTQVSKEVVGATYIQKGIILSMQQFTDKNKSTTVDDPTLGTLKRMPVTVLMSDGAPTFGSTDFTIPKKHNLGNGSSTDSALGFVSQLSAAYAKQEIEEKYTGDCLFYTLGLGVGDNSVATSVLNPAKSSSGITAFWDQYNSANVGGKVTVRRASKDRPELYVTKIPQSLEQNYVDEYFAVDSTSSDMAAGLKKAFSKIVGTIQLRSRYFPTLVTDTENNSGYISFSDRIGEYMQVTDVKGILLNNTLYSGAELANSLADNGKELGTLDNPTERGNKLISTIQSRMGIDDAKTAKELIRLAREHGQISYSSDSRYSNYIGWYANAKGEFLGFWYDGITTMPDPTDAQLSDEARPEYIMKSYFYLGEVDEKNGVALSDMMYADVRVSENISTGEQTVSFAIPAALIPLVTYNITMNKDNRFSDLTVSGAEHPIRLVYGVGLQDNINEYNITQAVSDEYLAENTNPDGTVNFYSNQYETDNSTAYGTLNTCSAFTPSKQNEKYYSGENSIVYSDDDGTILKGDIDKNKDYYCTYTVYSTKGGSPQTETVFRKLSKEAIEAAKQKDDATWYIPAENALVNSGNETVDKTENKTKTLTFSSSQYADKKGDDLRITAALGNNGKLTLSPATGIKLSKSVEATADYNPETSFEFIISNITDSGDSKAYDALLKHSDGSTDETVVSFKKGKGSVFLKAEETIYIKGMTAGAKYSIEETPDEKYILKNINGDSKASTAEITVENHRLSEANFVNTEKGSGNLIIAKEVRHNFGTDYEIPSDKSFDITVTLSGFGVRDKSFKAKNANGESTSVTTDENGSFTVSLKHNEKLEILDLPEGTTADVKEKTPGAGFNVSYFVNGQSGDGSVTVQDNQTASVVVENSYSPSAVSPVNITVTGSKTLSGRGWNDADTFTFELQKQISDNEWQTLASDTVNGSGADKAFDLSGGFADEKYTETGTYNYRIVEIEPQNNRLGGISYDKTVHFFSVIVADKDMDGALEIKKITGDTVSITHNGDGWNIDVNFTNTYSNTDSATVTIDINKQVVNASESPLASGSGFKFGLYDENGELAFESDETTDSGFARIACTYSGGSAAGTYRYILKEIVPDNAPTGWIYSTEEIPVTVNVTDDGQGNLSAVVCQGNDLTDAASISATFTNQYSPEEAELIVDFIDKKLTGRALKAEEFTFEVQQQDGTAVLTGTNDEQGNVVFNGSLKFDKVGVYYYNIVETGDNSNGVTYDKTVHSVAVTVTDDSGKLKATYTLLSSVEQTVVFENTYKAEDVSCTISGVKTLTGRDKLSGEFTFTMIEAIDEAGDIADNAKMYEAKNEADGTFSFAPVTFNTEGKYYYVVSEVQGGADGVSYDETKYITTIEVADNGEGSLVISDIHTKAIGSDEETEIRFENAYVEPTDPTEPTEPTEPTGPTDPTKPTKPTDPSAPETPTSPTNHNNPDTPKNTSTPAEPNKSDTLTVAGKSAGYNTSDAPKTGDERNFDFLLYAMLFSGIVLCCAVTRKIKKDAKEKIE